MPIASGASKVRTTVPSPTPGRRMSFSTRCSSHLIRTYVRTKGHGGRTVRPADGPDSGAGADLPLLEGGELAQRLGPVFGPQRGKQGDQVAFGTEGLARPPVEVEVVDVVGDQGIAVEGEVGVDVVLDPAAGGEGVAGDPVGGPGSLVGLVLAQGDLKVASAAGQHPPHRADVVALEVPEGGVVEVGARRVTGVHGGAVPVGESGVEPLDRFFIGQ